MRVDTLEGALLDYWVAKAEGEPTHCFLRRYSTEWHVGGPIIEREEIGFHPMSDGEQWLATDYQIRQPHAYGQGPTPLIAAMRCFLAMKYGEEVPE